MKIPFRLIFTVLGFTILGTALYYEKQTKVTSTRPPAKQEQTFAIIKPDAVKAGNTGNIIKRIEDEGFQIAAMKKTRFNKALTEKFYAEHKEKVFFKDLVDYMMSGPVVVMILEKDDAIAQWRTLMGATNPEKAEENTIRKLYGTSMSENAAHGSDSLESAKREISLVFGD